MSGKNVWGDVLSKRKAACDDRKVIEDTIVHYLDRFGNAASIGLLHPSCKVFSDSSIDGIIGYRMEHNCAVVIGEPLCAAQDKIALAKVFYDFCKNQKKKSIYALTSEAFTNESLACFGGSALQFGHDIIIDPTIDTRTLTGRYPHHLRQKFNHGLANGLSAYEYEDTRFGLEETFKRIAKEWLSQRKGFQAFMLPIDIFGHRSSKRWFYSKKDSQVVGLLMLSQLPAYKGWVLNGSIMLTPEAPNSTSEFLMLHVLEKLRNEGCSYLSIGPTVAPDIERLEGFDWLSQAVITYGMKSIRKLLKMNDRQRFWNKFQPHKEPSFIIINSPRTGLQEAAAIFKAFNVNIRKK